MRVLLTNDDGIAAPGLAAMRAALDSLGEVVTIAPADHQSASSHAVTFDGSLRVEPRRFGPGGAYDGLAVTGRPADCVKLGLAELVPGPLDLVVSGMNCGANVGINVIYSGTVAAAREAAIRGVPAIATSLHVGDWDAIRWPDAARFARDAVDLVLGHGLPDGAVVNVNVPILDDRDEPAGVRVVPACTLAADDRYELGDSGYRIAGTMAFPRRAAGTDVEALFAGYITITPLRHRLTCDDSVRTLASLARDASPAARGSATGL